MMVDQPCDFGREYLQRSKVTRTGLTLRWMHLVSSLVFRALIIAHGGVIRILSVGALCSFLDFLDLFGEAPCNSLDSMGSSGEANNTMNCFWLHRYFCFWETDLMAMER